MEKISLEHLRTLAYAAYVNVSMYPEKQAETIIKEYTQDLNNDLERINQRAKEINGTEIPEATLSKYRQRYESHLSDWLRSSSQVASAFIVGPANFPTEQMQKRRHWARNKYDYFREWRERALKAIFRRFNPKTLSKELEEVRQNLKQREETQQLMVAANKIIRKGGTELRDKLRELGLEEKTIHQILTPNWATRTGFKATSFKTTVQK